MSKRIEFPNEPIHVDAGESVTPRDLTPAEREEKAIWDEWDDDGDCESCEDGVVVCDGGVDCPEADDAGCSFTDFHTYVCRNCGGSGLAKDQRFW